MAAPIYYTADQIRALPDDGNRYEAVHGELLVADVLSPSSARADRFTKRIEYQRQGIPLYWAVDPEQYQVEVWTPEDTAPRLERERLVWHPAGGLRPFEMELAALFRPIQPAPTP